MTPLTLLIIEDDDDLSRLLALNASLSKSIPLQERKRLEFSINATNVLNHVNLTSFGTVVNSSNYGLVTAAGGMRTIQVVARFRF